MCIENRRPCAAVNSTELVSSPHTAEPFNRRWAHQTNEKWKFIEMQALHRHWNCAVACMCEAIAWCARQVFSASHISFDYAINAPISWNSQRVCGYTAMNEKVPFAVVANNTNSMSWPNTAKGIHRNYSFEEVIVTICCRWCAARYFLVCEVEKSIRFVFQSKRASTRFRTDFSLSLSMMLSLSPISVLSAIVCLSCIAAVPVDVNHDTRPIVGAIAPEEEKVFVISWNQSRNQSEIHINQWFNRQPVVGDEAAVLEVEGIPSKGITFYDQSHLKYAGFVQKNVSYSTVFDKLKKK